MKINRTENKMFKGKEITSAAIYIEKDSTAIEESDTTDSKEETENGSIAFDAEVVQTDWQSGSSLEDIYGIKVFSETFSQNVQKVNEINNRKNNEAFQKVLHEQKNDNTDEIFELVMNTDMERIVITEYHTVTENGHGIMYQAGFIVLGMIITVGILVLTERIKRKRKHENHNHNR